MPILSSKRWRRGPLLSEDGDAPRSRPDPIPNSQAFLAESWALIGQVETAGSLSRLSVCGMRTALAGALAVIDPAIHPRDTVSADGEVMRSASYLLQASGRSAPCPPSPAGGHAQARRALDRTSGHSGTMCMLRPYARGMFG